jgi:hypothetical protein
MWNRAKQKTRTTSTCLWSYPFYSSETSNMKTHHCRKNKPIKYYLRNCELKSRYIQVPWNNLMEQAENIARVGRNPWPTQWVPYKLFSPYLYLLVRDKGILWEVQNPHSYECRVASGPSPFGSFSRSVKRTFHFFLWIFLSAGPA